MAQDSRYVVDLAQVRRDDVAQVGGKNASLGEMLSQLSASGIAVPPGFATTADAYRLFLTASGLDRLIGDAMAAARAAEVSLGAAAADIRAAFER
ncbi:MAG: PEP/pyruvate-binding domain-containing protein, partial [Porticoccaceae bacterium]